MRARLVAAAVVGFGALGSASVFAADVPPAPEKSAPAASSLPDWQALWAWDDAVESERRFRAVLAESADRPADYVAIVRTQIARALGRQGKFDEAHAALDEAEKGLSGDSVAARGWVAIERGRAFASSKAPEKGKPQFLAALQAGKAAKDEDLAVDAAHMLGIVETGDESVRWNLEAMRLAEAATSRRARGWLGPLYNNLGWTYYEKKDFARALDLQEKNWRWHEAAEDARGARIGKWAYAKTLRALGRLDEAWALQQELLAACEAAKEPDGFVYEELAEILLAQGKAAAAAPWFRKAHEALSKVDWLVRDEPARLERLKALGATGEKDAR
jgi:tetratricopeptide (TPR) repeat protein